MSKIQPTYTIEELTRIYLDNELRNIEKIYMKNNSPETRVDMLNRMASMDNNNYIDQKTKQYIYSKFKLIYDEMCAAALKKD